MKLKGNAVVVGVTSNSCFLIRISRRTCNSGRSNSSFTSGISRGPVGITPVTHIVSVEVKEILLVTAVFSPDHAISIN